MLTLGASYFQKNFASHTDEISVMRDLTILHQRDNPDVDTVSIERWYLRPQLKMELYIRTWGDSKPSIENAYT